MRSDILFVVLESIYISYKSTHFSVSYQVKNALTTEFTLIHQEQRYSQDSPDSRNGLGDISILNLWHPGTGLPGLPPLGRCGRQMHSGASESVFLIQHLKGHPHTLTSLSHEQGVSIEWRRADRCGGTPSSLVSREGRTRLK